MASAYLPQWLHVPTLGELHALWSRPVTVSQAVLAGLGAYTVAFFVQDIYSYYNLLPQDMRGTNSSQPHVYLLSGLVRIFRYLRGLDGTSTAGLRRWVRANETTEPIYARRFLTEGEVPERRGPRATLLLQGVPQRQVPQVLDEALEEKLKTDFRAFAAAHSLKVDMSKIEVNALALFFPPSFSACSTYGKARPEFLIQLSCRASAHEFAHIHGGEGSLHVILSPLDAALAIERGWAVRFPLAGGPGVWGQAQGRVLLYAPRDEGEVEVVMKIVTAGWEYLTAVPVDGKA